MSHTIAAHGNEHAIRTPERACKRAEYCTIAKRSGVRACSQTYPKMSMPCIGICWKRAHARKTNVRVHTDIICSRQMCVNISDENSNLVAAVFCFLLARPPLGNLEYFTCVLLCSSSNWPTSPKDVHKYMQDARTRIFGGVQTTDMWGKIPLIKVCVRVCGFCFGFWSTYGVCIMSFILGIWKGWRVNLDVVYVLGLVCVVCCDISYAGFVKIGRRSTQKVARHCLHETTQNNQTWRKILLLDIWDLFWFWSSQFNGCGSANVLWNYVGRRNDPFDHLLNFEYRA